MSGGRWLKGSLSDQEKKLFKAWIEIRPKEESILILKKQLDRINRIIWIKRPSAEKPAAAGEKNPVNPVNPVQKK